MKTNTTKFKVTSVKTNTKVFNPSYYHNDVYVNGTLVGTHDKGEDLYCTVKNGQRSNLRTQRKVCHRWSWNHSGLEAVLGVSYYSFIKEFAVTGPDHSWGYTGGYHTASSIRAALATYNS